VIERSEAYKLADAVLSGRVVAMPPATRSDGTARVELKMCELCPRLFTREVGTHHRYCCACRTSRMRPSTAKDNVLRFYRRPGRQSSLPFHFGRRVSERDRTPKLQSPSSA